jgi:hypothetical protein
MKTIQEVVFCYLKVLKDRYQGVVSSIAGMGYKSEQLHSSLPDRTNVTGLTAEKNSNKSKLL